MKLSIIMPCYLGPYDGAALDRPLKLHRAISSFITSENKFLRLVERLGDDVTRVKPVDRELVLVSDGCDETDAYFAKMQKHYGGAGNVATLADGMSIKHVRIPKQEPWSGAVRNAGIEAAEGSHICYLDADDMVEPWHFDFVLEHVRGFDWIWFNDRVWPHQVRESRLQLSSIGTGCIAHRKDLAVRWQDGYAADWTFIASLIERSDNYACAGSGGYIVCHIPGKLDV